MEWNKILELKPHSRMIAAFGACTFISGVVGSNIPEISEVIKDPSKFEAPSEVQDFLPIAPYSLLLILLGIVDSKVKKKIDEEVQQRLEEKAREKANDYFFGFIGQRIHKPIVDIKNEINACTEIPEEVKDKLLEYVQDADNILENIKDWEEAADIIAEWLESKKGRNNLTTCRIDIIKVVLENLKIDPEYIDDFTHDVRECLSWIYYSVKRRKPYSLMDSERYTSAMIRGIPGGSQLYEKAIRAIREKLAKDIPVVNERALEWVLEDVVDVYCNAVQKLESEHLGHKKGGELVPCQRQYLQKS